MTTKMTRSQIQEQYRQAVENIAASGQPQHVISMAINQQRRWLDQELDLALPDPEAPVHKTLGERLRENMDTAERLRLDREQAASAALREKAERHRLAVSAAIQELQSGITRSINQGSIPKPLRMGRDLNDTMNYDTSITNSRHSDHDQWCAEMVPWADAQGLSLNVYAAHDGAGMEGWWELKVSPR